MRHERLLATRGHLALVKTEWLPGAAKPDLDALREQFRAPLLVTKLDRVGFDGTPEHGYRIWDQSTAKRRGFQEVSTFDYDQSWVFEASFEPVAADRLQPFEHARDEGLARDHVVPGDLHVTIASQPFTLSAFVDDAHLLLVFADATNRSSDPAIRTYGAGRFLFLPLLSGDGPAQITLDFNRAVVPPCGFSDEFNCPLAPPNNRFPFDVRAGERLPVFADADH